MDEMITKVKKVLAHGIRNESGQAALMAVLLLLALGALMLPPLLGVMSTGLKAGGMHESKLQEFYAADSGVEDALWQIKHDELENLFLTYDEYDYDEEYSYQFGNTVNDKDVDVTIENVWIPQISPTPSPSKARGIIGDAKLVVTGWVTGESKYKIRIVYNYQDVGDPDWDKLEVDTIGIWLPPGFDYVAGSSNLEDDDELDPPYYCVPGVAPYKGGQAVVWHFSGGALFKNFPGVDLMGYPLVAAITFQFTSSPDESPEAAMSWITTSGVGEIPFAWDADTKVYEITSVATDPTSGKQSTVEAYTAKTELRELSSAIAGKYRAIGNSLLVDNYSPHDERDTLLGESDAGVDDIPSSATVEGALLYWSGWLAGAGGQVLFYDECNYFDPNWQHGSNWGELWYYSAFYGWGGSGSRELEMKNSLDLSGYAGQTVTVSWRNWLYTRNIESGDCFQYAFSGNGGASWDSWGYAFCDDIDPYIGTSPSQSITPSYPIPQEYLTSQFKIKFRTEFSSSSEYVYIDNVKISVAPETIADTSVSFKINTQQVYFDELGEPQQGAQEIGADEYQVLENFDSQGDPHGFSYACFKDVTALVQEYSNKGDGDNRTGNGEYTVGGVYGDTHDKWAYAAWSLIIIYSSPETKGHQIYLYDDFAYADEYSNVDFDNDGEPGGSVSGFLVPDPVAGEVNAARLTCFIGEGDDCYDYDYLKFNEAALSDGMSTTNVWNSWSYGLSEDGIDIDTFYVTWASGLLDPGDTSAEIDLPTQTDSWNLVYIILAFRSSVTTGGTISYLIVG